MKFLRLTCLPILQVLVFALVSTLTSLTLTAETATPFLCFHLLLISSLGFALLRLTEDLHLQIFLGLIACVSLAFVSVLAGSSLLLFSFLNGLLLWMSRSGRISNKSLVCLRWTLFLALGLSLFYSAAPYRALF